MDKVTIVAKVSYKTLMEYYGKDVYNKDDFAKFDELVHKSIYARSVFKGKRMIFIELAIEKHFEFYSAKELNLKAIDRHYKNYCDGRKIFLQEEVRKLGLKRIVAELGLTEVTGVKKPKEKAKSAYVMKF